MRDALRHGSTDRGHNCPRSPRRCRRTRMRCDAHHGYGTWNVPATLPQRASPRSGSGVDIGALRVPLATRFRRPDACALRLMSVPFGHENTGCRFASAIRGDRRLLPRPFRSPTSAAARKPPVRERDRFRGAACSARDANPETGRAQAADVRIVRPREHRCSFAGAPAPGFRNRGWEQRGEVGGVRCLKRDENAYRPIGTRTLETCSQRDRRL